MSREWLKFPKESSGKLELVVVSQTRTFEHPSSASSNYPQPGRDNEDTRWSTCESTRTNMDTSGFQVSDQEDTKFHWENPQLNISAVFRSSMDTPFSPSTFNDFEMGSVAENPILIDEENNPPPLPLTRVSDRPTEPAMLMRTHLFGTRIENVPNYIFGILIH